MKKFLIMLQVLTLSITTNFAQDPMNLSKREKSYPNDYGGYGAPVLKGTRINGTDGFLAGAKGAWLINHNYALGGAVYMLTNDINFKNYNESIDFGYAGITLEYIHQATQNIFFTVGSLLGAGIYDFKDNLGSNDGIYIVEPELTAQYKLAKNVNLELAAGYRLVADTDFPTISNNQLSGISYGLSLRIGQF